MALNKYDREAHKKIWDKTLELNGGDIFKALHWFDKEVRYRLGQTTPRILIEWGRYSQVETLLESMKEKPCVFTSIPELSPSLSSSAQES